MFLVATEARIYLFSIHNSFNCVVYTDFKRKTIKLNVIGQYKSSS